MSDERWDSLEALFDAALELPPAARRDLIDTAARDDPALGRAVEALLESDQDAERFLADPIGRVATGAAPRVVGAYRILERLGEGGMSTVYLAARNDDAFERRVVVKIVRRGAESVDSLRRFRLERQILARLDHLGI